MLVIVHYRYLKFCPKPSFYLKTTRGGDVFQVDATENRSNSFDRGDDFFRILRVKTNRKSVYSGKLLKNGRFAFHYRYSGVGTQITKTQNGRAVGNDGHAVLLKRIFVGAIFIFSYFSRDLGYSRRVSKRQRLFAV